MEIMTQEKTKELKPYPFNQEIFGVLSQSDYGALREDIRKNGVKVELHILPDKTVICGHQRLMIANELGIEHLRCKTVYGLDSPELVKEYVIIDNLLRRQLTSEKRAFLHAELIELKGGKGDEHEKGGKPLSQLETRVDVFQEVADLTKTSRAQVARDVAYVRAVKNNPIKYKGKKMAAVLRAEKVEKDKKQIEEKKGELELKGIFKTVVIDPPWEHYGSEWGYQRREKPDYATMSLDEIEKYIEEKVIPHIDKDAHIYLWVINNRMHDAFHLLDKWGFDYKTVITWCKPQMGMGKYFRNNTEQLLFAVKGSLSLKKQDIPTWFVADRGKHSVKPDEAYDLIEKASHAPYVDIFSRKKRKGWETM